MVLYPNKLPESERVCSGICILWEWGLFILLFPLLEEEIRPEPYLHQPSGQASRWYVHSIGLVFDKSKTLVILFTKIMHEQSNKCFDVKYNRKLYLRMFLGNFFLRKFYTKIWLFLIWNYISLLQLYQF